MPTSFLELCSLLTGYKNLSPVLADLYYSKLVQTSAEPLARLLATYDLKVNNQPGDPADLIGDHIWNDPTLRLVSQQIIQLWYTAALPLPTGNWVGPANAYFEALLWKTIEAHPPALSGGYFGYWRYAPEN